MIYPHVLGESGFQAATMLRLPVFEAGKSFDERFAVGWRWIRRPRNHLAGYRLVAVQIGDDALTEAAIIRGDYCVCRIAAELDYSGQLAAVQIAEGLVIRYVHVERRGLWLRSANRLYRDRFIEPERAQVQGVVLTVERDL